MFTYRVDTSQMGAGLSSWLHIAHASLTDNGNYTCSAGDSVYAFVRVHVLDGSYINPRLQDFRITYFSVFQHFNVAFILSSKRDT